MLKILQLIYSTRLFRRYRVSHFCKNHCITLIPVLPSGTGARGMYGPRDCGYWQQVINYRFPFQDVKTTLKKNPAYI